jgi:hypothetical protein
MHSLTVRKLHIAKANERQNIKMMPIRTPCDIWVGSDEMTIKGDYVAALNSSEANVNSPLLRPCF